MLAEFEIPLAVWFDYPVRSMVGARWRPESLLLPIPKLEVVMWSRVENLELWIRAARRRNARSSVVAKSLMSSVRTELPVASVTWVTKAVAVESKTALELVARTHALPRVKVLESISGAVRDIHFDFYQILETGFLNRLIFAKTPPGSTTGRCRKTDRSKDHARYRWYSSTGRCRELIRDQKQVRSEFDTIAAPDFADQAVVRPHPTQTDSNPSAAAGKICDHAGRQTLHLATDLESPSDQTQRCPESASLAMVTTAA